MDTASPSISPSELAAVAGRADAPLLLDVRPEGRFAASGHMLAGAIRCRPDQLAGFAASQPPRVVVAYCVYGHEVSRGSAQILSDAGWDARYLAGGFEGGESGVDAPQEIELWRATPPLRLRKRPDLGVGGERASRWITRERPKIDRIACPWLIRRFIDPRAEFLYLPTEQVLGEARRLDAVAYDIPGAPISHEGELCSFDALLAAFELRDPALDRLARIVRGADTDRLALAPQSAGLLAVSLGLSVLYADDQRMLEAAMPVYDALHAWCRSASAEKHGWDFAATAGAPA
jgi:rhodanese-related sulfurtransferase